MNKVKSPLFIQFFLPSVDHGKDFLCILPGKRFQRRQTVTVLGKPDRNNGNTLQMRQIPGQIRNASFQLRTVVVSFTEHDLSVHLNPCLIKALDLWENVSRKTVMQHFAAKLGIGRLE